MLNPLQLKGKYIYISGPITGIPENNFKEFALAEEKLNFMGFNTINPHNLFQNIDTHGFTHQDYMDICICWMSMCKIIVLLPGYEWSVGALQEIAIAKAMHKRIININTFIEKENLKNKYD